jgi:hypothetical protein
MWHYKDGEQSHDYRPRPIRDELVAEGAIIFLGKRQHEDHVHCDRILTDFDRLLPLYEFVESGREPRLASEPSGSQFVFCPGCSSRASSTTAKQVGKKRVIILLQNRLQDLLCRQLVSRHGAKNVGDEHPCGVGTRADVVVRLKKGYWFYEIKTADSPRACIREAIGQLLEYAFWPGRPGGNRLIVVGKTEIDKDAREYLRRLRKRFHIPIEYKHLSP